MTAAGIQNCSRELDPSLQNPVRVGPEPPQGKGIDWIESAPGKGWFVLFRLYGPFEPWFDETWKPGDFEPVK